MRYRRTDGLSWDLADDRVVVLDASAATLVTLNPSGSVVWVALDVPRSGPELAAELVGRFPGVDRARVESDVAEFVERLARDGLVTVEADAA